MATLRFVTSYPIIYKKKRQTTNYTFFSQKRISVSILLKTVIHTKINISYFSCKRNLESSIYNDKQCNDNKKDFFVVEIVVANH